MYIKCTVKKKKTIKTNECVRLLFRSVLKENKTCVTNVSPQGEKLALEEELCLCSTNFEFISEVQSLKMKVLSSLFNNFEINFKCK